MDKITSLNPKQESNPDIPYDHVLPYLNFSPIIDHEKKLKFNASLMCKLARDVGGEWEIWPEVHYAENVSDISSQVEDDPDLAVLVAGINQLLSNFLQSRGA